MLSECPKFHTKSYVDSVPRLGELNVLGQVSMIFIIDPVDPQNFTVVTGYFEKCRCSSVFVLRNEYSP